MHCAVNFEDWIFHELEILTDAYCCFLELANWCHKCMPYWELLLASLCFSTHVFNKKLHTDRDKVADSGL
jgi:hypothetical protein